MFKTILLIGLTAISSQAIAQTSDLLKTNKWKTVEVTKVIELDTLNENCDAIKQIAKTAIELRYTDVSLASVYKHADELFPKKSDAIYKNLFKLIAKDAYQELLYEHEINIKKEQKAFIDRQHIICKAAYSKF